MKKLAKIIALVGFVVLAFYISRSLDITREGLRMLIESYGAWGPVIYISIYTIGTVFLFPGTLITSAGAILFGTWLGFVYTLIGATLGASVTFWVARLLGKGFVDSFLHEKWKKLEKYDENLEENGFLTIYYLRMVFFPFNALNFGAGLTKVKFKDYFWGTFLGIIPGTFIFTFFFDSITSITSFQDLLAWQVLLSVGLFIVSFSIPLLVKKYKKKFIE